MTEEDFDASSAPAYSIKIHVACPVAYSADKHLADYCRTCVTRDTDSVGLCVTIQPEVFIHKDGMDYGIVVGLVNYPRFPKDSYQIRDHAFRIARLLIDKLGQDTALVDGPDFTTWVRRKEQQPAKKEV